MCFTGLQISDIGQSTGRNFGSGLNEIYMLDLAGQKKWNKLANMREERQDFDAGTIDGKICVLGGHSNVNLLLEPKFMTPKLLPGVG